MIQINTQAEWDAWLSFLDWLGDLIDDCENRLQRRQATRLCWWDED